MADYGIAIFIVVLSFMLFLFVLLFGRKVEIPKPTGEKKEKKKKEEEEKSIIIPLPIFPTFPQQPIIQQGGGIDVSRLETAIRDSARHIGDKIDNLKQGLENEIRSLKGEVNNVQGAINNLTSAVNGLNTTLQTGLSNINTTLSTGFQNIANSINEFRRDTNQKLNEIVNKLGNIENKLDKLKKLEDIEKKLGEIKDDLSQVIKNGFNDLKSILNDIKGTLNNISRDVNTLVNFLNSQDFRDKFIRTLEAIPNIATTLGDLVRYLTPQQQNQASKFIEDFWNYFLKNFPDAFFNLIEEWNNRLQQDSSLRIPIEAKINPDDLNKILNKLKDIKKEIEGLRKAKEKDKKRLGAINKTLMEIRDRIEKLPEGFRDLIDSYLSILTFAIEKETKFKYNYIYVW